MLGRTVATSGFQSPAIYTRGDVSVAYGLTAEQAQELTRAAVSGAVEPLTARIIDLSEKLGVTQGAALALLRIIGEVEVPLDQLRQKLEEVAHLHKAYGTKLHTLPAACGT